MGFLKSLFGTGRSSEEKMILNDDDLGAFAAIHQSADKITWKSTINFLGETVELFIHGDKQQLDTSQKNSILSITNNEPAIEPEIDRSLKEQYDNAGKAYTDWRAYFNCISIASSGHEVNITMEEKESFHSFTIQFINGKATDVAIDS